MAVNSPSQIVVARRTVTTSWAAATGYEFFGNQSTTLPDWHSLGRGGALENVNTPVSIFAAYFKIGHKPIDVAAATSDEQASRVLDVKWARDLIVDTYLGDQMVDSRPAHSMPHSAMLTMGVHLGTVANTDINAMVTAENAGNPWPFPRIRWPAGACLKAMVRNVAAAYTILGADGLFLELGYQIAPQGAS